MHLSLESPVKVSLSPETQKAMHLSLNQQLKPKGAQQGQQPWGPQRTQLTQGRQQAQQAQQA